MARSSLCEKCQVLQFDDKALGAHVATSKTGKRYAKLDTGLDTGLFLEYSLKDTFPDLPVLAEEECGMCAFLRERFLDLNEKAEPHLSTLEITGFRLDFRPPYTTADLIPRLNALMVDYKLGDGSVRSIILGIQAEPEDPCYNWLRLSRRPIASSVLSESGILRMKEMIESAISRTHYNAGEYYLPTRLVHVGDEQHEPRLVVSESHPPFFMEKEGCNAHRYIALSYCWGSRTEAEQQLKTTRDSVKSHMQRIPIEALPQTLLDAVLVCRALGVRYLWVDVLCIIQGDKVDWERESATMANVYSHSFLTVCAAQGDSCQSGFLKRHPPSQVEISFHSSLDPSRFSTNVSGKYLAGLWSDNLHHGLIWVSTHRDGDRSEIKSTYTAPSWSWACQPGPVTFHKSEGQVYQKAKVLTAETSFTIDPYGQITDGFVLLSAKIYKISSTRFGALKGIPNEPFFRHDLSGNIHSDATLELSLVPREGEYTVFVWFDQNYKSKKHLVRQMSIVLVSTDPMNGLLGLLVLPATTQNEYTRAGVFRSRSFDYRGAEFWDNVETTTIKLI
ncbi:heterokaryon incompatibility protein-domain-containing protein [Aspergillus arachidicola]|uniref:Heterokaryon incompatibility protein-domain-containing protein n=1 Tax=Aspergillus arachidicola TaxID=656916 RepID=A0A5N6YNY8_9EURO|nr:heterokaryon incompatibility protein-domain-containing protein [Aspergillus arachidicola]